MTPPVDERGSRFWRIGRAIERGFRGFSDSSSLVRDDRGIEQVGRAREGIIHAFGSGEMTSEEYHELRKQVLPAAGYKWLPHAQLVVLCVVVGLSGSSLFFRYRSGLGFDGSMIFMMLGISVLTYSVWHTTHRVIDAKSSVFAQVLRANRRCGVCAYDLRRGNAEADGCVVCPECRAAWRFVADTSGAVTMVPKEAHSRA